MLHIYTCMHDACQILKTPLSHEQRQGPDPSFGVLRTLSGGSIPPSEILLTPKANDDLIRRVGETMPRRRS